MLLKYHNKKIDCAWKSDFNEQVIVIVLTLEDSWFLTANHKWLDIIQLQLQPIQSVHGPSGCEATVLTTDPLLGMEGGYEGRSAVRSL